MVVDIRLEYRSWKVRFNPIDKDRYELCFSTGVTIFFSCGKPVAGYVPSFGYIRTAPQKGWFNKTNRHVKEWLKEEAKEVDVKDLEGFINSSGMYKEWYPS